jgi:DinB superfamily
MRKIVCMLALAGAGLVPSAMQAADKKPPTTLRGVLLEQLRTTHNEEDWFVPAAIAVQGLTAEQAKWTPGKDGHSVGQLAYHLWFWDTDALARFKGEKPPAFNGNNDQTFNDFSAAEWSDLVQKLN